MNTIKHDTASGDRVEITLNTQETAVCGLKPQNVYCQVRGEYCEVLVQESLNVPAMERCPACKNLHAKYGPGGCEFIFVP